jgi:hypothetical protein
MKDLLNAMNKINDSIETLKDSLVESKTKSRYEDDGIYSHYVVLVPTNDGGGLVFSLDGETKEQLASEYCHSYEEAEKVYESWGL